MSEPDSAGGIGYSGSDGPKKIANSNMLEDIGQCV